MAWVRAEDAKSLKTLQADPHYRQYFEQALSLEQASDRIPLPEFLGEDVANLWQDSAHKQGIWRRTTLADYRLAKPNWHSLLDLDALSKTEHRTWVFKGDICYPPDDRRCLIALSDGGEDATVTREFDTAKADFVAGGFDIPHSKQEPDWQDENTLLVATDWGPGSMTESGYPFIVKQLHRGQNLADAKEVFRGAPADVAVQMTEFTDAENHHVVVLERGLDFFRNEFRLVRGETATKLDLPEKAEIDGLVDNRLIVKVNQDYTPGSWRSGRGGQPDRARSCGAAGGARDDFRAESTPIHRRGSRHQRPCRGCGLRQCARRAYVFFAWEQRLDPAPARPAG